jgi:cell division protein FtsB
VIPEPIEQAITEHGLAAAYAGRYNDSHYRADKMKTERAALVAVIAAELTQRDARIAELEAEVSDLREDAINPRKRWENQG